MFDKGIPCVTCSHISRDHDRNKKQPDGSWNGPCSACGCKLYKKPKQLT